MTRQIDTASGGMPWPHLHSVSSLVPARCSCQRAEHALCANRVVQAQRVSPPVCKQYMHSPCSITCSAGATTASLPQQLVLPCCSGGAEGLSRGVEVEDIMALSLPTRMCIKFVKDLIVYGEVKKWRNDTPTVKPTVPTHGWDTKSMAKNMLWNFIAEISARALRLPPKDCFPPAPQESYRQNFL